MACHKCVRFLRHLDDLKNRPPKKKARGKMSTVSQGVTPEKHKGSPTTVVSSQQTENKASPPAVSQVSPTCSPVKTLARMPFLEEVGLEQLRSLTKCVVQGLNETPDSLQIPPDTVRQSSPVVVADNTQNTGKLEPSSPVDRSTIPEQQQTDNDKQIPLTDPRSKPEALLKKPIHREPIFPTVQCKPKKCIPMRPDKPPMKDPFKDFSTAI